MRAQILRAVLLIALAGGVAGSTSCTGKLIEGDSNSYLIITSLTASCGATDEETGTNLQSDVVTEGSAIEDEGIVEFTLGLKNIGTPDSPAEPTVNNFITVTRYRVVFRRADGRNTPGVDVPWGFDGAFTVTVGDGPAEANFSLVRIQAKLEQPLLALRNLGGLGAISTIAEVTFYGHDQTGRAVSATGQISVDFADYADPE